MSDAAERGTLDGNRDHHTTGLAMMRHLSLILIFTGLIASAGLLASRAQARWSVWVYHPVDGRLLQVDNNGQVVATRDLAPVGSGLFPARVVVSPDGTIAAYQPPRLQQIIALDLTTGTQLATISLSEIGAVHTDADQLILDNIAFTADGNHLIYSEKLGGFGWQLHVHDLTADERVATLAYNDENTINYPALHGGIIPQITAITADRITFTVEIDYPRRTHSYHWFYTADILSETVAAPVTVSASNPFTADIVTVQHDHRFPADNEDFRNAWQQVNTLFAYHTTDGRFPVFYEPSLSFQGLWLVQGGERVLVEARVDQVVEVYLLVERDGNEIRRYPAVGDDTTGTPDGYIYTTRVEGQTAVVTVDTRNIASAGETLWIQPGDWHIVWAGVNQPQSPLIDWLQLAQSQQDPTGIVSRYATPTQAPDLPPFRQVGMSVQIFVPDEGFLNLRDAPTTDSNVLTLLESGSRGVISSGPVEAEGFLWWEVSIAGRVGWVVEELPNSLALIPPQVIPSLTPTPTVTPQP